MSVLQDEETNSNLKLVQVYADFCLDCILSVPVHLMVDIGVSSIGTGIDPRQPDPTYATVGGLRGGGVQSRLWTVVL